MTTAAISPQRLIITPAGLHHADELDGDHIVARPVDVKTGEADDGSTTYAIAVTGEAVVFYCGSPGLLPYEGGGDAASVLSRMTLRQAAARRTKARDALTAAAIDLRNAIVFAHDSRGMSPTAIADEAGVSRQYVHTILKGS